MMKKMLLSSLAAVVFLSILTGCNRTLRRDQSTQEPSQPAALAATNTSIPTQAATATQALPSETPAVQPTATSLPTQGISQSDVIANQLDSMLGQFDTQLQGVDTIPETP